MRGGDHELIELTSSTVFEKVLGKFEGWWIPSPSLSPNLQTRASLFLVTGTGMRHVEKQYSTLSGCGRVAQARGRIRASMASASFARRSWHERLSPSPGPSNQKRGQDYDLFMPTGSYQENRRITSPAKRSSAPLFPFATRCE